MFKLTIQLFNLLTSQQRKSFYALQFLIILMSFFEILGIVSIIPFMSLVGDMSQLENGSMIAQVYTASGIQSSSSFVLILGFGVLFMLFLSAGICMFTTWRISMFATEVGAQISARLYSYYLYQDWLFHTSGSIASFTKKITNESSRVSSGIIVPLLIMNSRILFTLAIIISFFVYDPTVGIIGFLIFSLAYFILFKLVRVRLYENGQNVSSQNERRFSLINESLGSIKEILVLGRQQKFINLFNQSSKVLAYSLGANQAYGLTPKFIIELLAFSSMIILLLYLLGLHEGSLGLILPVITVYALATFKLLPALQQIYVSVSSIKGNIAAFESIQGDLFKSLEAASDQENSDTSYLNLKEYISLKDIEFTYPKKNLPTLKKIRMSFPAKSITAIVGASGSGKSTLINIILGLLVPQKGHLMIDGEPLNKTNMRSWQNNIGFVTQNIFLSDGTIAQNIAFGIPEEQIDHKRILDCIELACLSNMIDRLELGINTQVGEDGVKISGGQRQRIAIARALYQNSDILIFDEATSSLDGVTEEIILDTIEELKKEKTIIMIAHRLKAIKRCDEIYIMENGEFVGHGTYQNLIETNKHFRNLTAHT
jgi:ABC-type multidrug transport system fused ATPase/permease subunit